MKPTNQGFVERRGDRAGRVHGEEDGEEVGGVCLEGVFGVEDREGFGVELVAGGEDGGGEVQGRGVGGKEVVGGGGVDEGGVGEEVAED